MIKTFQDQKDLNYSQLYNEHKRMLFFFAQSKTRNSFDADDLTSKTFIKGYLNFEKYNPQQSFKNWIITICNNTFLDDIRRERNSIIRYTDTVYEDKSLQDIPYKNDVSFSKQYSTVKQALKQISPYDQRIINLYYFDNLYYYYYHYCYHYHC